MSDKFDFKTRLGSGNFGEVWLADDTSLKMQCAVKCIPLDKVINQGNFFYEAQLLKAAEHPNIVKVNETGKLHDGQIYVSMEYLEKGSLEDEAKGGYVALTRAKKLMIDVLRGLEHAHSKNIIHRDIKPANILIGTAFEGKLSDFGLALSDVKSLKLNSIKRGYYYVVHLAPEVRSVKSYTQLSDIYACGVTLYRLVNGDRYLPALTSTADIISETKKGKFPDRNKYREFIPRAMKLVINKAMDVNPLKRFQSAQEMRRALEQVRIQINWHERLLPEGIRWSSTSKEKCFKIERKESKPKCWEIEVAKGNSKLSLKRVGKMCFKNLKKHEAEVKTKKILQEYVTNGPS